MMKKDVPRHLVPVVVKYYFIQDLHASLKLEVVKSGLNRDFDFDSHTPLLHTIFAILLYNTITVQNIHKQTNIIT